MLLITIPTTAAATITAIATTPIMVEAMTTAILEVAITVAAQ